MDKHVEAKLLHCDGVVLYVPIFDHLQLFSKKRVEFIHSSK